MNFLFACMPGPLTIVAVCGVVGLVGLVVKYLLKQSPLESDKNEVKYSLFLIVYPIQYFEIKVTTKEKGEEILRCIQNHQFEGISLVSFGFELETPQITVKASDSAIKRLDGLQGITQVYKSHVVANYNQI